MKLKALYPLLLAVLLASCSKHYIKNQQEFNHYSLKESPANAPVDEVVKAYKTNVDSETEKVIALSTDVLSKNSEQSPLGNFVCDALRHAADSLFAGTKPDLILANRGGLRINLPKGNIKVVTIFELMPFENEMVLVTVSGQQLQGFIPLLQDKMHPFYGAKVDVVNGKVTSFLIDGKPIDPAKNYRILTSDYLAHGGDNFTFLEKPIDFKNSNFKIRDAIINYCVFLTQHGQQITPYTDERLTISK